MMILSYITLLLSIIVICAILSGVQNKSPSESFAIENVYTCKDYIIEMLKTRDEYRGMDIKTIEKIVSDKFKIEPEEFLEKHGIKLQDLPPFIRQQIPNLTVDEVLVNIRRQVDRDIYDNNVPVNQCIIPARYMKSMQNGNSDKVQVYNNPNSKIKQKECKLDKRTYPSNIKAGYPNDFGSIANIDSITQDKTLYLGCQFGGNKSLDEIKAELKDIYELSDSDGIRTLNNLIVEYNKWYKERLEKEKTDEKTRKEEKDAEAWRNKEQEKARKAFALLEQQREFADAAGIDYNDSLTDSLITQDNLLMKFDEKPDRYLKKTVDKFRNVEVVDGDAGWFAVYTKQYGNWGKLLTAIAKSKYFTINNGTQQYTYIPNSRNTYADNKKETINYSPSNPKIPTWTKVNFQVYYE